MIIYLIISIYQINCPDQTLNLYTNECLPFDGCPGECIIYNTASTSCIKEKCPNHKLYNISNKIHDYTSLNSLERCTSSGFQDMESCQELINDWSINYYKSNELNQINCPECKYRDEFINFTQSFERSYEIEIDTNVPVEFRFSSILTFILSKYDKNGTFLGFKEVTTDLNKCGEKNDIGQVWRQFGTNFYSDCNFNLPVMNNTAPNEFYDLYLMYENNEGQHLMKVPVLIRNHGRNSNSDSSNYELYRRFFLKFSNNSIIKYAQNVTIQIQFDSQNSRQIKIPLLIIQYNEITYNSYDISNYAKIDFSKRSSEIRDFHFSVVYLRSLKKFWMQCRIILIVFLVLGVIVWILRCIIYAKHHKDDGTTLAYFLAAFCESIGTALTIITFLITFCLIFVFFKFQKQGYFCLPPENELNFISIIVWISFSLMLISSIIRLVIQAKANVIIIDWENQHNEGVPISAWRRLMIANEYNRILSKRSYSMNFLLVLLIFFLEGLRWTLLSSPIPRTELIDVGKSYKVLHFGFTSFVWILLMIVWYPLTYLWVKKTGDPYLNFIDLCTTANCSVLIMNTKSQGFYIHGRSNHDHTDVDMQQLVKNMVDESKGHVGCRGLLPDTGDQVFHVYLEDEFAEVVSSTPELILEDFAMKALKEPQILNSKVKKEVEELKVFNYLNKLLRSFFEGQECPYKFDVVHSNFWERFFGWGPPVEQKSVLVTRDDYAYRQSLFAGIEWTFNVMYLLLFAGVEMETRSPAIAAFLVFIFDLIFMAAYSRTARINFARKAILDGRYIIS